MKLVFKKRIPFTDEAVENLKYEPIEKKKKKTNGVSINKFKGAN